MKALAILRAAVRAVADITPGWQTTPAAMHAAPAEDVLASAC